VFRGATRKVVAKDQCLLEYGFFEEHSNERHHSEDSESDQADTQGVDDMNDNDEWVGYSHWGMFPLERKSSN
jgi:hypothetical protein